jgi:hypothetical protein
MRPQQFPQYWAIQLYTPPGPRKLLFKEVAGATYLIDAEVLLVKRGYDLERDLRENVGKQVILHRVDGAAIGFGALKHKQDLFLSIPDHGSTPLFGRPRIMYLGKVTATLWCRTERNLRDWRPPRPSRLALWLGPIVAFGERVITWLLSR